MPIRISMNGLPGLNLRHWLTYLGKQKDVSTTYFCKSNKTICQTIKEDYPCIHVVDIRRLRHNPLALFWELVRESHDLLLIQGLYKVKLNLLLFVLVRARRKIVIIWNVAGHQKIALEPNKLESRIHKWMLLRSDGILFTWKPTQDGFIEMFPELADKTVTLNWGYSDEFFDLDFAPQSELTDRLLADVGPKEIFLFFPRSIYPYHRHDMFIQSLPFVKEMLSSQLWSRVRVLILGGECDRMDAEPLIELIAQTNLANIKFHWSDYISRDYMWCLYNRADILINLSDPDVQPGGAIFEAMARNTIVIASDTDDYRHLTTLGYEVNYVHNSPMKVAETLCKVIERIDSGARKIPIDLQKNRVLVRNMFDERRSFNAILTQLVK